MTSNIVRSIIHDIWKIGGLDESFLRYLQLIGDANAAVKSSFRVGQLAQATTALAGLAASAYHHYNQGKTEDPVKVKVDARHAVLCFSWLFSLSTI